MKNIRTLATGLMLLTSASVFAEKANDLFDVRSTYGNTHTFQQQNWKDVYDNELNEVLSRRAAQEENYISNFNDRIDAIEQQKRTSFNLVKDREIDIYVRESYTILENDYVIKNAPVWKKVLIKPKQAWEY